MEGWPRECVVTFQDGKRVTVSASTKALAIVFAAKVRADQGACSHQELTATDVTPLAAENVLPGEVA